MSPILKFKAKTNYLDRRHHRRYPISRAAYLVLEGKREETATVDISSGGVLVRPGDSLPVGRRVQLFIDWPVLLNQSCALRLVIDGKVLRSNRMGTAIGIVRYEFCTRPRSFTDESACAT